MPAGSVFPKANFGPQYLAYLDHCPFWQEGLGEDRNEVMSLARLSAHWGLNLLTLLLYVHRLNLSEKESNPVETTPLKRLNYWLMIGQSNVNISIQSMFSCNEVNFILNFKIKQEALRCKHNLCISYLPRKLKRDGRFLDITWQRKLYKHKKILWKCW